MKKLKIILDAAHGEEVPGKRSPDGVFREYKWSRDIVLLLTPKLIAQGYEVFQSNPTTKEIGLTQRAVTTNKIAGPKIFISIHANAAGNGVTWMGARGYSVYTTKGNTKSDILAEILMKEFKLKFPELKARTDTTDGDLDTEEDFTVLVKTNCPSVLIEWNFQDNREDVAILTNSNYNNKFVDTIIAAINTANNVLI